MLHACNLSSKVAKTRGSFYFSRNSQRNNCSCKMGCYTWIFSWNLQEKLLRVPPAIYKTSLLQTCNVPNRSQGINPGEVQDVTIQRVKMPTTSTKRSDGIRFNLYNLIPNVIGDLAVVEKLRTAINNFSSIQFHSALPASNDVCKVSCKFGDVPKGSMLSYQQRVKLSNKPKVHINIEAPDPPSFTLPPVNQTYSTVLTMSQD